MSFRRKSSKYEDWSQFSEQHRKLIVEAALPDRILASEATFEEYLRTGSLNDSSERLAELSDEQFSVLETVVHAFYFDGWDQKALAGFSNERYQRFGRHA